MTSGNAIYFGIVTHKRLRPVAHALRYRVFNLFIDVDRLDEFGCSSRLFGYNRTRLVCVRDTDHGPGDGTPIAVHVRRLAARAPRGETVSRIMMLCYPRMLGYVFNPLTVYYCFDRGDVLVVTIFEVSNTFGERHSYIVPAPGRGGVQTCAKRFYVSPYNSDKGRYSFHAPAPDAALALGIALRDDGGPLLKAYVAGKREELTDRALIRAFLTVPLMTFKVIAGIHWEALRLYLKGLRPVRRPPPPPQPFEVAGSPH